MKLGVIGCGKMGTALVQGALVAGVVEKNDIIGTDLVQAARDHFTQITGAKTTDHLAELLSKADVILLCTKPQDISTALSSLSPQQVRDSLLISIAAGVKLTDLEAMTPISYRIVRCMPNTPALVGKGAAAYCLGQRCFDGDEMIVKSLLDAVGISVKVPEKLMDAVTGLSGSGPAYVYLVIEALADGGVMAGLARQDALLLAAQTVSGAAEMVLQSKQHPATLKDMVTSPGGTTIEGLSVLENRGLRSAMIDAVMAANRRAFELGKS